MSPHICQAVAAAVEKKGLTYAQVAAQVGTSEQHIIDVCSGKKTPTTDEFNAIAKVLDITGAPHDTAHKTT